MVILCGEGKPQADLEILSEIATAPRDRAIIGAWVSKTGKLLAELEVCWLNATDWFDEDDCPVNVEDWQGWSSGGDCFVYPSHWRDI